MFIAHQIFKIFITENQQILIILKLSDICQPELAWFGIPTTTENMFLKHVWGNKLFVCYGLSIATPEI